MQPRIEQKLNTNSLGFVGLLRWLHAADGKILYPSRQVSSTYFDTPSFQMYHDTVEGIVPRRKVRIRCYGIHSLNCGSSHTLETKLTTELGRRKQTQPIDQSGGIWNVELPDPQYGWLRPSIHVTYEREYFSIKGIRMTIDRSIRYSLPDSVSHAWTEDDEVAVEIKAPAETNLDWLSNEFPFPRIHFSKYERAVARLSQSSHGSD